MTTSAANVEHGPAMCIRDVQGTQYVGNGYKSKFTCPACSRFCWQHLGRLGQRNVLCDGRVFTKQPRDARRPHETTKGLHKT